MLTYLLLYLAVAAVGGLTMLAAASLFAWAMTGRAPRPVEHVLDKITARRRSRRPEPMPTVLHELELARIAGLLQHAYDTPRPGQAHHVRASTAAYDDALLRCCVVSGVAVPACQVPLSNARRFDLETRLMAAGVQW